MHSKALSAHPADLKLVSLMTLSPSSVITFHTLLAVTKFLFCVTNARARDLLVDRARGDERLRTGGIGGGGPL